MPVEATGGQHVLYRLQVIADAAEVATMTGRVPVRANSLEEMPAPGKPCRRAAAARRK